MPLCSLGVSGRRLIAASLLLVVVLVVGLRHLTGGTAAAPALRVRPVVGQGGPQGPRPASPASRLVVVDVAGAVRRPGLVRLPSGSRVADAIARAGGLTRSAERSGVNLAAPVADGEQVLVPARGAAGAAAAGGGAPAGPVSLSAASLEQLDALPGIGPVTAQKIVDYRAQHGAFRSVDELDAIPGIGPAKISQLQGLVVP